MSLWRPTPWDDEGPLPLEWQPYRVLGTSQYGRYLLAEVEYTGYMACEGRKLLLFQDVAMIDLIEPKDRLPTQEQKVPIARFPATDAGRALAAAAIADLRAKAQP